MQNDSPLVSIVIPTFNAGAYLAELCESIQAQTHAHFEVLILDDGSTDQTTAVLAPYRKDARFKILRWEENRGVNAATAKLLGLINGAYWCNPGADDVLKPQFLERRLALMEAHPEAVLAHGPAEIIDEVGRPRPDALPIVNLPGSLRGRRAFLVLLQHNILNTTSVLLRSDATRLVLPYFLCNWRYAQDWYLWLLHAATGLDMLYDPESLNKYRVHAQSLSCTPALQGLRRAEIRLVPLCAASAAARFSQLGAEYWSKWRQALYRGWLLRAIKLRHDRLLQPEWLDLAGRAYYGPNCGRISLARETGKHLFGLAQHARKERQVLKTQSFRVSGIAQIDDAIFR